MDLTPLCCGEWRTFVRQADPSSVSAPVVWRTTLSLLSTPRKIYNTNIQRVIVTPSHLVYLMRRRVTSSCPKHEVIFCSFGEAVLQAPILRDNQRLVRILSHDINMAILDYEYNSSSYPAAVKRGIDFLYEAADRKAAVDAWVDCFSKSGTVVKNDFQANGHDGKLRYVRKILKT